MFFCFCFNVLHHMFLVLYFSHFFIYSLFILYLFFVYSLFILYLFFILMSFSLYLYNKKLKLIRLCKPLYILSYFALYLTNWDEFFPINQYRPDCVELIRIKFSELIHIVAAYLHYGTTLKYYGYLIFN